MVAKRLGEYLKLKSISFYAFENSIKSSRGSISKAVKENKSIGSNMIENILNIYKDLNPIWLFTGNGNVLLEEINQTKTSTEDKSKRNLSDFSNLEIVNYISDNIDFFKSIRSFQLLLKSLYADKEISDVKKEIEVLKKEVFILQNPLSK